MAGQAILTIQNKQWDVSLATAPWELAEGLGGLPSMPAETGILFDLGWEQIIQVTTVPMLFNLDIAFFSEEFVVTEVYRDIEPGYLVTSTLPARYFLEVNAGELEGIARDDRASVELLPLEEMPVITPDWASIMISFAGLVVMGILMVGIARDLVKGMLGEPEKRPTLLPQTRPEARFKRGEIVRYGGERVRVLEHIGDRVSIWIPSRQEEVWVKPEKLERIAGQAKTKRESLASEILRGLSGKGDNYQAYVRYTTDKTAFVTIGAIIGGHYSWNPAGFTVWVDAWERNPEWPPDSVLAIKELRRPRSFEATEEGVKQALDYVDREFPTFTESRWVSKSIPLNVAYDLGMLTKQAAPEWLPSVVVMPRLPEEAKGDVMFVEYIRDLVRMGEKVTDEEAKLMWEAWKKRQPQRLPAVAPAEGSYSWMITDPETGEIMIKEGYSTPDKARASASAFAVRRARYAGEHSVKLRIYDRSPDIGRLEEGVIFTGQITIPGGKAVAETLSHGGNAKEFMEYRVEKNEPYDTWAIVELWPGGTVRSPFKSKDEAIKREEEISQYYDWKLRRVELSRAELALLDPKRFPKRTEALTKLKGHDVIHVHDDGDLTVRSRGKLYVVTTEGQTFEQKERLAQTVRRASEAKPTGTCYADAWRFLIKEEEGELVHGTVFSGGRRIGHAWVETPTGYVWEPETGRYFTQLGFKDAFAPVVESRYTAEEAAIMAARTKNLGPWREEERRQYLIGKSPAIIPKYLQQPRSKDEIEFLPDSPEFLAFTIDDIGYRDKIDSAFQEAIRRAKGIK